jgi:hypothetical protein
MPARASEVRHKCRILGEEVQIEYATRSQECRRTSRTGLEGINSLGMLADRSQSAATEDCCIPAFGPTGIGERASEARVNVSTTQDWHVADGALRLRLPDGAEIVPSASEVVGAEFKGRMTIRGQTVDKRPSEALPEIEFSRFPPDVRVRVRPPAADLSVPPECRYELTLNGSVVDVAALSRESDQLLIGGRWLPLASESLAEAGECLKRAGIAATGVLTLRQYVTLRTLGDDLLMFDNPPEPAPNREAADKRGLPPSFIATLYPYQANGADWLGRIADEGLGCILADEMGLGKTVQVIAILAGEIAAGRLPSLILAPATILENWRRELTKFAPSLRILPHRGAGRTGFPASLQTWDVVLTTYDTAMRDLSLFKMIAWNIVILDEAQAIKTPDAQRTQAVKEIPRRVGITVTGTPVENRLRDLWSLMDFSVPGFLGSLPGFEQRFADTTAGAAALEPIVSPLMLRRRVADVARDLPERIDIPQAVELSDEAAAEYDAIRARIVAEYGAAASLVAMTKLRLFCTHPFLVNGGSGDPLPHSTKYARLLEILEEILSRGEKALIFTSFTEMADILHADLPRRFGVPCTILDGRVDVLERQPVVDAFQNHTGSAVLALNPRAAGVGLNITAANHVIHYNLEWNPAVEDQATARAFRRGQTRPVTVHRLFHARTIEEVIDQRLLRKREIAGAAVIGIEGTADDLADILRAIEMSPVRREDSAHAR